MTARRPLGLLLRAFLAFLALSVAAMHSGVLGGCADPAASSTSVMATSAMAMTHPGSTSLPESPQVPGHVSSHLCASTLPPQPAGVGAALGLLVVLPAALAAPTVVARPRFSTARRWPPPPPLSSLCVWRI
jgi:hypothetical protein